MEFQVSHIFTEGNQVADALSKHALGVPSDLWWSSTSSFCSRLVGYDYMGRESFRFSYFCFFLFSLHAFGFFGAVFSVLFCFSDSFISFFLYLYIYGYCLEVFQHMIYCDAFPL